MSVVRAQTRVVLVILATATALLLVGGAQAQAATITVDVVGADEATDGDCLLAEALEAARTDAAFGGCAAGSGDDVIVFDKAGTVSAPAGGFEVASNVTIQGHSGGTTISGGGGIDVVLTKRGSSSTASATEVTLTDLTISGAKGSPGGKAEAGVTIIDEGDAAFETEFTVTLDKLDLKDNRHGVNIDNTRDQDNHSGRRGTITIKDSVIRESRFAGVFVTACAKTPKAVTVEVVNSVVRSNGLRTDDSWHRGVGGIDHTCGYLRVVDSAIHGNSAMSTGGIGTSLYSETRDTHTEIINTTITNNTAHGDSAVGGRYSVGGVSVAYSRGHPGESSVRIVNSTITSNTGAVNSHGGDPGRPVVEGDPVGGFEVVSTFLDDAPGTKGTKVAVEIRNSVIGGNSGKQCFLETVAEQSLTRAANASSDETCGFGLETDDVGLAGLADNTDNGDAAPVGPGGGLGNVPTRAIDMGSPLFGAADNETCQDKDARGVARPQGFRCDIGAYEAKAFAIGGDVWVDADGNSVQDDGESPLEGVTLNLLDAEGDVIRSAMTDNEGSYSFDVQQGIRQVTVAAAGSRLDGYRATTPTSLKLPVSAGSSVVFNYDFGYEPLPGPGDPAIGASEINVNTLAGDAPDGRCSLVEAIRAANTDEAVDGCLAGSGDHTINIIRPGTITAPAGGFEIASNMTIQGHGGGTTISGGGGVEVVLTKVGAGGAADTAGATKVRLADLTITGATGAGVTVRDDSDTVSLRDGYDVTLENLLVKGNAAEGVRFVKKFESARPGAVSVKDSVVEGNRKGGVSMKACDASSDPVVLKVVNSSVRSNTGPAGESDWSGGVTNLCGRLEIRESTISGNTGARAAVWAEFGGWQDPADKSSSRKATTTTVIVNSTIADNKLPRPKRSDNYGGAIHVSGRAGFGPILEVQHVTIARNEGDRYTASGIHVDPGVRAGVYNTAIVGNKTILPSGDPTSGRQCRAFPGGRLSLHFTASSTEDCRNRVVLSESSLANLADNDGAALIGPNGAGGHIETIAINADSALFGTADAGNCSSKDARGVSRPQGTRCDVGAYEARVIEVDTLSGKADDGDCSLEEAIEAANTDDAVDGCAAGSGDDIINIGLPDDTTKAPIETITAPAGGFEIASNMTIQGHGGGTTISGGGGVEVVLTKVGAAGAADTAGATKVRLADLTITGAVTATGATPATSATGAGVTVKDDSDTATLTDRYDVTLENLLVEDNAAEGIKFKKNQESARSGGVSVINTVIDGNSRGIDLDACGSASGDVVLTIANSIIRRNRSHGVDNSCGRLTIERSTISANVAPTRDATGFNPSSPAVGVFVYYPDTQSTAEAESETVDARIVNTTISGNGATITGGGVRFYSNATNSALEIVNSTIAGNLGSIGGLQTTDSVNTSIVNSVVADNRASTSRPGTQCSFGKPPITKAGNASSDDSCGFDLTSDEVRLGDLADNTSQLPESDRPAAVGPNGATGYVPTRAIDVSSELFNAGDDTSCKTTDARGVTRPKGSKCDIGAYEADEVVRIEGVVWKDTNNNRAIDAATEALARIELELVDPANDEVIADARTDAQGRYSFEATAGRWTVRVVPELVDYWIPERSKTKEVTVEGASALDFDFGFRRRIVIEGRVWNDANGDGLSTGETRGLAGVTVEADNGDGRTHTTTTKGDGEYEFKVVPGEWTVTVAEQIIVIDDGGDARRYEATTPTSIPATVDPDDADRSDLDFGFRRLITIGGRVWNDANGDGMSTGETGIAGVEVELVDASGNVKSVRTDSSGDYSFEELPGRWTVRVAAADPNLAGYRATTASSLELEVTASSNFDFGYTASAGDHVINVNTLKGDVDDGLCSLVEALVAAETDQTDDGCVAGSGDDTIDIRVADKVVNGQTTETITAPDDGFQITSNVTVNGAAGGTTIRGGGGFKVMVGDATVTAVTLADLTVTGASGPGVWIEVPSGSAVSDAYTVTLTRLHVKGNSREGVKFHARSTRDGTVKIENTGLDGNDLEGVYMDACAPPSKMKLEILNSVVVDNDGAGVRNVCGDLKVENSLIAENEGKLGGVHAGSGRTNSAGDKAPTVTEIVNTTIIENGSTSEGGGVTVERSDRDTSTPKLAIKNATILWNGSPGGIHVRGSAVVSITNTVVVENIGDQCSAVWEDSSGNSASGNLEASREVTLTKSGSASSDDSCGFGPDLENLTSDEVGLGDLDDNTSRLADDERPPGLGPNGANRYVETMAIGASSKLFNAVEATACDGTKDARGVTRPQGSKCDIGAYEADELVTIEGHVWVDANGDDARDEDDGISGVTVELAVKVAGSDPPTYRAVRPKETDGEGAYSFEVTPGDWKVTVKNPPVDHQGPTEISVTTAEASGGTSLSGHDFKYVPE